MLNNIRKHLLDTFKISEFYKRSSRSSIPPIILSTDPNFRTRKTLREIRNKNFLTRSKLGNFTLEDTRTPLRRKSRKFLIPASHKIPARSSRKIVARGKSFERPSFQSTPGNTSQETGDHRIRAIHSGKTTAEISKLSSTFPSRDRNLVFHHFNPRILFRIRRRDIAIRPTNWGPNNEEARQDANNQRCADDSRNIRYSLTPARGY